MGLADIKKELKKLDKNKLIELFAELYKKNNSVNEFLNFYPKTCNRVACNWL